VCLFALLGGTTANVLTMIAIVLAVLGVLLVAVQFAIWIRTYPRKGARGMRKAIEELKRILQDTPARLTAISETESLKRPSSEKWSKRQILGHLIDSAANNHQRFIRGQLSAEIKLPGYQQEAWVSSQHYGEERWEDLIQLWTSYNTHLLHVVSFIPESALRNICILEDHEPVTLEFLVTDYVRHLRHHLEQILG